MENQFCIQGCRFHVSDEHIFLIRGYWKEERLQKNTILVSLDYQALPVRQEQELSNVRAYIDAQRPCSFWVTFPDNYEEYKTLRVFEKNETELLEIYRVDITKVKKMWRPFQAHVDEVKREKPEVWITGWYIAPREMEFELTDEKGERYDTELWMSRRPDVEKAYPEAKPEHVRGFRLRAEGTGKKINLTVSCPDISCRLELLEDYSAVFKGREGVRKLSRKVKVYYQQFGLCQTILRCYEKLSGRESTTYEIFRMKYMPGKKQLELQRKKSFPVEPEFAVVVPLYRTPKKYLDDMIQSVLAQTYGRWKLYLSDGSGPDSPLLKKLEGYAAQDERIVVIQNRESLKIVENTNRALKEVTEDYIVFLDHDDMLTPDALYECVRAINKEGGADIIYTDEDKVSSNGKKYYQPHFKPDFNLDFLRSANYMCHLYVVSRKLFEQVGFLREEYEGSQDYDFILRCVELARRIIHIPKILYHWRIHPGSVAGNPESKKYAYEAGRRAISAHYERVGIHADIEFMSPGYYRTVYTDDKRPLVSVIIPNKDHKEDLRRCIESLENEDVYKNLEIIIVENNSETEEIFDYYKELEICYKNICVLYYEKEFNYSAIQNFAAARAQGEYLLLLNNDVWMAGEDGIKELVAYGTRSDVGIVGARLFYPDDTIQHAGVIVGLGGVAGHAFLGMPREDPGYFCRAVCVQDYSAVTAACMLVRKEVFWEAGGMDTELQIAFNDTDFCLRVGELGYRIVYNPFSVWYHDESKTRGAEDTLGKVARFQQEILYFQNRWKYFLERGDPAYNPNLTLDRHDFSLKR